MPRWRSRTVNTPRPVNPDDSLNTRKRGWWLTLPSRQSPTKITDLYGRYEFTMQSGSKIATGGMRPGGLAAGYDLTAANAMGSSPITPPTAAITLGCWFKTTNSNCSIMGWNGNSTGNSGTYERDLYIEADGKLNWYVQGAFTATTPACNDGRWHFGVATLADDATTGYTYLDGIKYQGGSGFTVYNGYTTPYLCVGLSRAVGNYLTGYIDDWFFYDRCLTAAEVFSLYVASRTKYLKQLNWRSPRVGAVAANPVLVTPGTLTMTLTKFAPSVLTPRLVTPPVKALTTTKFAPVVSTPRVVTPPVKSLTLTKFSPQIQLGIFIPKKSLALNAFSPVISTPVVVTVPSLLGSVGFGFVLHTSPPTIKLGIIPPTRPLIVTFLAPEVQSPRVVIPPSKNLSLSSFSPTVGISGAVVPGTLNLILQCFPPVVSAVVEPSVVDTFSLTAELDENLSFASELQSSLNQSTTLDQSTAGSAQFQQVVTVGAEGTFSLSLRAEL